MAQADYSIADQGAAAVRAEMNEIFSAIVSQNSGATEPTTMFASMSWYDTSTNILKIRNAANDAWIDFATFDQTNDTWYFTKLRVGTGVVPVGAVGMAVEGTHGTDSSTAGPHKQFTTAADNYPLLQIMNWAHDNIMQGYDSYFDGSNWKSSDLGSNFRAGKTSDEYAIWVDENIAQGSNVTFEKAFAVTKDGYITHPKQPCFLGVSGAVANVTGDGTIYTIVTTEVTDRSGNFNHATGIFTAPITNNYSLQGNVASDGYTTAHDEISYDLITSNRSTYRSGFYSATGNSFANYNLSVGSAAADMDAGDVASTRLLVNGTGAAKVIGLANATFSGVMV